jgi:hypothetical protein
MTNYRPGFNLSAVAEAQNRIIDYLRENPEAVVADLRQSGLGYDFNVGYRVNINNSIRMLVCC